ncbi:MAG: hypothetical protein AB1480_15015 [Nitrospirota bacterium]
MKNILVVAVIFGLLGTFTATGCKKGRESTGGKPEIQTFVTYKYTDPMTGMEAFRLLIPKGWRAEGKIIWSSNPALPAQAGFRFYNPKSTEELNLFPTQSYFWTNNQIFLRTNPPGTFRFGTLVMSPIDLNTAFTKVIIPKARARVTDLRIINKKEVSELAKLATGASTPGVHSSAEAGKIRIQYTENGRQMEEEMYAAVSQFITELPGSFFTRGYFINYWYIDYVFSLRAEKGKLDSHSKVFQTMVYSLRANPRWFAKVANVKEMMAQQIIRGIRPVGRIGEMVARAGSEMREDQMRSWEQRQQAQDRIAQNFSDYIRGVDRFYDPLAGKEVELPSGYGRAWANNLGEYIVTDSPSYNPNIGSNLHWEELNSAK